MVQEKKKQHQAQAKHFSHISNLSSNLHSPGHSPVLALQADPSSSARENKNVQSDLEWYLSCWHFSPVSTTLSLHRVEWILSWPNSGSFGKAVIHQVYSPALGTACPNWLRHFAFMDQPFWHCEPQLGHLSKSERVWAYYCFRK